MARELDGAPHGAHRGADAANHAAIRAGYPRTLPASATPCANREPAMLSVLLPAPLTAPLTSIPTLNLTGPQEGRERVP